MRHVGRLSDILLPTDTNNNATRYSNPNVPPRTYYVRVRARNSCGTSLPSNERSVTTVAPPTCSAPVPPQLNLPTVIGSKVDLRWTSSPGARSYALLAGQQAGSSDIVLLLDADQNPTTYSNSAVPAGVYYVRVRVTNSCGASVDSNEVVVRVVTNIIFVLHGIGQSSQSISAFADSLRRTNGNLEWVVDGGFDYGDCAADVHCSRHCTIKNIASRLGDYLRERSQFGNIALVGYSLGGLVARELIANSNGLRSNTEQFTSPESARHVGNTEPRISLYHR